MGLGDPGRHLSITRIEVSANQVEYAEIGHGFVAVLGRARPLVTFTKLDIYHLARHNRQMFQERRMKSFWNKIDCVYVYIHMSGEVHRALLFICSEALFNKAKVLVAIHKFWPPVK